MYRGPVFFPADQYALYINTYILIKPDANYSTTNHQYIIHFNFPVTELAIQTQVYVNRQSYSYRDECQGIVREVT